MAQDNSPFQGQSSRGDEAQGEAAARGEAPSPEPQAAQGHNVRATSWVTVVLIIVGVVVLAVALPMTSLVLGIVGGVIALAGLVLGAVTRIMDDAY